MFFMISLNDIIRRDQVIFHLTVITSTNQSSFYDERLAGALNAHCNMLRKQNLITAPGEAPSLQRAGRCCARQSGQVRRR